MPETGRRVMLDCYAREAPASLAWSAPTASATEAKPSRRSSSASPCLIRPTSAGPLKHQRGIELHQRRAGADLGVGVLGAGDTADPDQRQLPAVSR